jgi:hypothetical protein
MLTIRSTAVALFLLLSPTLVWPQASKPSSPALGQQTQQPRNTGDSATQSDAATLALAAYLPLPFAAGGVVDALLDP